MPEPTQFQPMENQFSQGGHPHDRGEPTVDSGDLARQAAAAAVRGEQKPANTASPGTQFTTREPRPQQQPQQEPQPQERQIEADADSYSEFEPMDQGQEQQAQPDDQQQTQQQDETTPRQPGEWTPAEYEQLQEMGIDLPVRPDEVPENFRDGYAQLAETVLDAEQSVRDRLQAAENQIAQVRGFKETLQTEEGQQRLLLGMALNNQDLFHETVEMVQRMAEDPQYAQSVQRQIEADMKLKAAEQRANALDQAQRLTKGRQVENRTARLARRHNVNPDLAERMVIARIRENQAQTGEYDISLQEVDEVVKSLANDYGATQRVKSPDTQQREKQANTQRAQGTGQEPNQQQRQQAQPQQRAPQPSDSGREDNSLDRLRNAVRTSAKNVRAKGL